MDEPSYDVIANPISSFTTFGEAAPSQQIVARENLTAPVDFISPLVQQMGTLSNTLAGIFVEGKRKESEQALVMGGTEVEASLPEILKARKENALDVATLVDKGIITNNENPWFAVGARRALAKLNVEAVSDMIDRDLDNDFLQGGDLMDNDEPTTAMANYMGNKMNPLNIAESVQKDYYYSSTFEEGFSKVRRRATKRLIELRTAKEFEDQVNAFRADLGSALRNGLERPDIDPNALGLDGEPITALDPEAAALKVLGDYNYRAAFGNAKTLEIGGLHLLELAKDGDQLALQVLTNTKLPNGKTLLEASDAVKVQYDLAEDQIARAIQRQSDALEKVDNERLHALGKQSILQTLVEYKGDINELEAPILAAMFPDLIERDPFSKDGMKAGGKPISLTEVRNVALEQRFSQHFQEALNATPIPETFSEQERAAVERGRTLSALVIASNASLQGDGYIYQPISRSIDKAMNAIQSGQAFATPEGEQLVKEALDTYQMMKATDNFALLNAYFSPDENAAMFLLDAVYTGDQGVFRAGQERIGSGDIKASMQFVSRKIQDGIEPLPREYKTALNEAFTNAGFGVAVRETYDNIAALRFMLGNTLLDADDFAQDIVDNFFVTGDTYTLALNKDSLPPPRGEALFDSLIDDLLTRGDEGDVFSGPVSSALIELSNEQMAGDETFEDYIRSLRFVSTGRPDGSIEINRNGFPQAGGQSFTMDDFIADQRIRASAPKTYIAPQMGKRGPGTRDQPPKVEGSN